MTEMTMTFTKTKLGNWQIIGTDYVLAKMVGSTWAAFLAIDVDDLAAGTYWASRYHDTRRSAYRAAKWHQRGLDADPA